MEQNREKRNLEKERAMQMAAQYVKEAKTVAPSGERLRLYSDPKRGLNVCFREKVHECEDRTEECEDCGVEESWGVAICNPGDTYNKTVGEYLAIKRARGGKVPKSILPFI